MTSFQIFETEEIVEVEQEVIPEVSVDVVEADDRYGKFVAEPLPKGYGVTLGNPLRRVLYGSLPGTAVTWVKIDGVLHEYTTIPHVKEEVQEFLLNVKGIRLRSQLDRPGKLRLDVAGQGDVCAGDIMASSDFDVVNPELHLATLDTDEAKLSVELNVERGVGYAEASVGEGLPLGVLPVDAVYTPIKKVNFGVETIRVGRRTDFERLNIEIWTDGSIVPIEALRQAGEILVSNFFRFANAQRVVDTGSGPSPVSLHITPEHYNVTVEQLELSSRTLNCLKRASLDRVGQILEKKPEDLLEIKNFGQKSLTELCDQLRLNDLITPEFDPEVTDQPDNDKDVGASDENSGLNPEDDMPVAE